MKKFKQKLGKVLNSRLGRFASLAIMVVAVAGIFVAPVVSHEVNAQGPTGFLQNGAPCYPTSPQECESGICSDQGYCVPEMPIALVPVFLVVAGGIAMRVRRKAVQTT